jgi:hypothetical protein
VFDERDNAALVVEPVRLPVAFIVEGDDDAPVQKRELAQALREDIETEGGGFEDLVVGLEGDLRASALGRPRLIEIASGRSALVTLLVGEPVAPDLEIERFRQGVDDRDANAMQAARHLVAVVIELASRVENRQDDLGGGLTAGMTIHRDATAIVDNGDGAIDVNSDVDLIAKASKGLVNGVIDDLVHQVVQAAGAGGADVHRRPLLHSLEPLKDLDLVGRVVVHVGQRALTLAIACSFRACDWTVLFRSLFPIELCHSVILTSDDLAHDQASRSLPLHTRMGMMT